jgi:hypothetical protein
MRAFSTRARRIIWASKRSACDYAGLLECLWRFDETSCDLIDITDLTEPTPIFGLGVLNPKHICEKALWTRAAEISAAAQQRYRESWRELREQNAPFRVVENLQLLSAPITAYDALLLTNVTGEWIKSAEVIGHALAAAGTRLSDVVLFSRLRRLIEDGKLEARGNVLTMRSEVRLPS